MTVFAKSRHRWSHSRGEMRWRGWTSLLVVPLLAGCSSDASSGGTGGAGSSSVGASGGAGSSSGGAGAGSLGGGGASAGTSVATGGNPSNGTAGTSAGQSSGGAGSASGGSAGVAGGGSAGAAGSAGSAPTSPFKGVANSDCADLPRLGASWWYNWVLSPGTCKTGDFVPMIAGKSEKTADAVSKAITQLKTAGYRTVLGFNEPNKTDQSNLSVAQVVELWPSLTADPDVRVGSPATSADAKAWFEDFMAQAEAKSLRVDFVAIHWYGWNAGSCNDAKELESYVTWAEKFGRPIWITEFGCLNQSNPTAEVVQGFYASALAALSRHPMVERYAWYPWTTNNELVEDGALTGLGDAFAAAPKTR